MSAVATGCDFLAAIEVLAPVFALSVANSGDLAFVCVGCRGAALGTGV